MITKLKEKKKIILIALLVAFLVFYVSPSVFYQNGGPVARYTSVEEALEGRHSSFSCEFKNLYLFYIGIADIEIKNYHGERVPAKRTFIPFIYSFDIKHEGLTMYTITAGNREYYYRFATN